MTVSATYLDDLSRVRIAFSGVSTDFDRVLIQRSIDGINWSTVRGGATVAVVSGAGKLDDYEFVAGVPNYYRLRYTDDGLLPSYIAAGTGATGNNASVVPAHPAGLAVGDLKLIAASIRNSGAGSVVAPAGWTKIAETGNLCVLGRVHQSGDTAPTVTFSGGVANADTLAQMINVRYAKSFAQRIATQTNVSAQDVASPLNTQVGKSRAFFVGWKQDDFTSSSTPAFANKIGDVVSTAGDDAGMFWDTWAIPPENEGLSFNPSVTITGGAAAISRSMTFFIQPLDYTLEETTSVTPVLDAVWIKNINRPSQNTKVKVTNISEITRPSRVGIFEVIGRTMPIAVTDVQGSRRLTLTLWVGDLAGATDMDSRLSTGETLFIQGPANTGAENDWPLDAFYAVPGDIGQSQPAWHTKHRYFELPLVEVAAPGAVVYGDTILWADVPLTWATWSDVVAAKTSWSNLQDSIATGNVIVP